MLFARLILAINSVRVKKFKTQIELLVYSYAHSWYHIAGK